MTGCIFLFVGRWAYNWCREGNNWEEGYKRNLTAADKRGKLIRFARQRGKSCASVRTFSLENIPKLHIIY